MLLESEEEKVHRNSIDDAVMKEGNKDEENNNMKKETAKNYDVESMSKESLDEIVEQHALADKKGEEKGTEKE